MYGVKDLRAKKDIIWLFKEFLSNIDPNDDTILMNTENLQVITTGWAEQSATNGGFREIV